MSNITSTLILQLKDDGLQAKARADAEALKKLGASGADLKKLAGSHPEIGRLVGKLDGLAASGAKLDAFRAGARNLKQLGAEMRAARGQVTATAAAVAKAEGKGAKAAERAHRAALKRSEAATEAWTDQARAHRTLRNELLAEGVGLGARGASGGRGLALGEAMRAVAAQTEEANHALRQQVHLVTQAGQAAQGAITRTAAVQRRAGPSLVAGMGGAGRAQLDTVEAANAHAAGNARASRRMIDGMGAPARASREAAEAARLDEEERRQARRQEAGDARRQIAGAGLLVAGHKAAEMKREVLHVYQEFDDLSRYQEAVADLTPDERRSRIKQALHLGGETRFNDLQVLHAQLDLAQRGVKKQFVEPFIGEVVNYAQAMNTDLGSAAKTLEGIVFSTNQDVESPETAVKTMRRQVDLAVKMAKIGGLTNDDVSQAFKFGGASSAAAGLSNETQATIYALLRRNGYEGSSAGVAARAFSTKLVAPTNKGLDALDAMGIRYENFTTMPRQVRDNVAQNTFKRHYGKSLTPQQDAKFKALFDDETKFGDRNAFIEAATNIVSSSFDKVAKGKNKGKLSAQDRKSIAKTFGDMHKNLVESVDAEGLWNAILEANPTLGQAAAYFTKEHAGKIKTLATKRKEYKEYHEQLEHTPEGFAKGVGDKRNAGYAGAATRLEGAQKNLESSVGQALDNNGEGNGGFLTGVTSAAANAVQALAELPKPLIAVGASAAWLGGKLSSLTGAAILSGTAAGVSSAAIRAMLAGQGGALLSALGSGAAAAAPVALPLAGTAAIGAALIAADKSKAIVHGGKNVDTRLDFGDELPGLGGDSVQQASRTPSLPPGASQASSRAAEGIKPLIDQPAPQRAPAADNTRAIPSMVGGGVPGRVPGVGTAASAFGLNGPQAGAANATPIIDTGKVDELNTKLGGAQGKARELGGTTASPQVNTGLVDELSAKLGEAEGKAKSLGSTSATPQIGTGPVDGLIAKLLQAIGLVGQLENGVAQANASIASVNASAGRLRGRTGGSFSDGVTPGAGAE